MQGTEKGKEEPDLQVSDLHYKVWTKRLSLP